MKVEISPTIRLALIALCIFVMVASMIALVIEGDSPVAKTIQDAETTTMTNIFVDINGDGYPDYVRSAEVIINPGVPLP